MPPVNATKLEKPEKPHHPIPLSNEDFTDLKVFLEKCFMKIKFLKYLNEVVRANRPINIKIYLSSRYSKHNHPNICPESPPKTIIFKIFKTGNFLHVNATKKSVIKYTGSKTAIANLGGKTKTIIGMLKEPRVPPKPDFEMATKITAKKVTGIKISN